VKPTPHYLHHNTDSMADKERVEAVMEAVVSFISSHIYLTISGLILVPFLISRTLRSHPNSLSKSEALKISEVRSRAYPVLDMLTATLVTRSTSILSSLCVERACPKQLRPNMASNMIVCQLYTVT
jgi:hypothetical protein